MDKKSIEKAFKQLFIAPLFKRMDGRKFEDTVKKILLEETGALYLGALKGREEREVRRTKYSPEQTILEHHPNSKQSSPDFWLSGKGKLLQIEAKHIEGSGTPMWNSGWPGRETIYIFNSRKGTAIFLGSFLVSAENTESQTKIREQLKKVEQEAKKLFPETSKMVLQHARPMWASTCDFYTEQTRYRNFEEVLSFIANL